MFLLNNEVVNPRFRSQILRMNLFDNVFDTTLTNRGPLDDEEAELHEPMQLEESKEGEKRETKARGRLKNRWSKKDRPKMAASRPAQYRDFVSY